MRFAVACILASSIALPCKAQPITCEQFRDRLSTAVLDAGEKVAQPDTQKLAYQRDDKTFARYELNGIVDMRGNLGCGSDDAFRYFEAFVDVAGEDASLRVARLTSLAAAAACAAEPKMAAAKCGSLSAKLTATAVKGYSAARVRGEEEPSAYEQALISRGYQLQLDAETGRISFSLAYSEAYQR